VRDSALLRDCPFVDVDADGLETALERLVRDPGRREAVGRAGRAFAVEQCSYEATGRIWEALVDHVWRGAPLPEALLAGPDRPH